MRNVTYALFCINSYYYMHTSEMGGYKNNDGMAILLVPSLQKKATFAGHLAERLASCTAPAANAALPYCPSHRRPRKRKKEEE